MHAMQKLQMIYHRFHKHVCMSCQVTCHGCAQKDPCLGYVSTSTQKERTHLRGWMRHRLHCAYDRICYAYSACVRASTFLFLLLLLKPWFGVQLRISRKQPHLRERRVFGPHLPDFDINQIFFFPIFFSSNMKFLIVLVSLDS